MEENNIKKEIEIADKIANIISKLVIARNDMNLTQEELAKKCGLKQSAIARMENLKVFPRIDTIIRVAKYLNVDIDVIEERTNKYIIEFKDIRNTYENMAVNFEKNKWSEYNLCLQ